MKITRAESSARELIIYALIGLAFVSFVVGWALLTPDSVGFPTGIVGFIGMTAILFTGIFRYVKKHRLWNSWQLWAVLVAVLLVHSFASFLIILIFARPLTILMVLYFIEYPSAGLALDVLNDSLKKQRSQA